MNALGFIYSPHLPKSIPRKLSDAGSQTIDAYGIRNKKAPERWKGIPHLGTFIVDQKGVIRAKLFLENYRDRHAGEAVIKALKEAR